MKKILAILLTLAAAAIWAAEKPAGAKCIVTYTFDDGLLDQYTHAYPLLKERGIPATFFIIGSKVGDPEGIRSKAERATPLMTWENIREMASGGMEIASHGWAHAKYNKMAREAILDDMRRNQTALKENAGVDCVSFAAPYNAKHGADASDVAELAREAGMKAMRMRQVGAGGSMTAEKMNARVEKAKKRGEWVVFMTHGMTRGYDAWADLEEFKKHLDWVKTQSDVWTATFADAAAVAQGEFPARERAKARESEPVVVQEAPGSRGASRAKEKKWWLPRHEKKLDEIAAGPKNYDLAFIGDSITDFWQNSRSGGGKVAKESFKGLSILNLGVMGDRIDNMMWRLSNGEGTGWTAKVIMILCGTNDIGKKRDGKTVAARTAELVEYVKELHPEAKIVLLPILPRVDPKRGPAANERIAEANKLTEALADGKRVYRLDFTAKLLDESGALNESLFKDGLHPNEDGYKIWAEAALPLFKTLLEGEAK